MRPTFLEQNKHAELSVGTHGERHRAARVPDHRARCSGRRPWRYRTPRLAVVLRKAGRCEVEVQVEKLRLRSVALTVEIRGLNVAIKPGLADDVRTGMSVKLVPA